jgi:hypothetical protein
MKLYLKVLSSKFLTLKQRIAIVADHSSLFCFFVGSIGLAEV